MNSSESGSDIKRTTFIYALCEPDTGEVRYIGKADDPEIRFRRHLRLEAADFNTHKSRWVRSIRSKGLLPKLEILCKASRDNWREVERLQIRLAKMCGLDLVNGSPGGEGFGSGADNPNYGKAASRDTRAKMSASAKMRTGRFVSTETRNKLRAVFLGRKMSPQDRAKLSASKMGVTTGPRKFEHKLKIGASQAGRKRHSNSSRYLGVFWKKQSNRWAAALTVLNHNFYLGMYDSEEDAAITYNWAASLYGRPVNLQQ